MPGEYAPKSIEAKWQSYWDATRTFRTPNPGDQGFDPSKKKYYVLDMFPYPSGAGLHVGHPEGYTATDIVARYRRMKGFNVLHTMGWDAFGLPAEQHAIDTGQHPAVTTQKNVDNFRRQLKMLGFSYDWDRELSTTDPDYYRWTQWIFLQLFNSWYDDAAKKARPIAELEKMLESEKLVVRFDGNLVSAGPTGFQQMGGIPVGTKFWHELPPEDRRAILDRNRLAYLAEVPVNWCPALGTVLSNEEVTNEGRSERGNFPVYRRPLKQWMLRITKYADRLEEDLTELDWPESVKLMQRNWIGRSEGAQVKFQLDQHEDVIEIFTTRPDTLFGATYMVLAPEHPLVEKITTPDQRDAVRAYVATAANKSDMDRTAETKKKTGVFTGAFAINPVNEEKIPVWVADYVLMTYGTGAIMAVPGHDVRDFEFAKQFDLPIRAVVRPSISWLKEQIAANRIDLHYAGKHGKSRIAEMMLSSAATAAAPFTGIAPQEIDALSDIDSAWIDQVAMPGYLVNPELFENAFTGAGHAINSGRFNGLPTAEFKKHITNWLEEKGIGCGTVNYKLRDWLFSRQRYWGEPFPVLHGEDGEILALDESELPLTLPPMTDFRPTVETSDNPANQSAVPRTTLGRAKEWMTVQRHGKTYSRELNTMPQWAGSCWYYLRFLDPHNNAAFCGKEVEQYWMLSKRKDGKPHVGGIDLYVGGAEHAVLHLLYARFWHKVLYDLGHVSTIEPFGKLFNQGMIRAFAYTDSRDAYIGYEDIDFREDGAHHKSTGEKLKGAVEKMSKSMKNVINPEEVVNEFGGDSLRLYEMFMGPLEASKPWNPRDVPGVFRFLQRAWRMIINDETGEFSSMVAPRESEPNLALERTLHKTIKKVGEDIDRMAFNTGISAMMEFVNEVYRAKTIHPSQAERFTLILAPYAPHIAEELWQRLRGPAWKGSLAYEPWPTWDPAMAEESEVEIPVQVNGKMAGKVIVAKTADEAAVKTAALADEKVKGRVGAGSIVKTIYVPGRMVNLIVK
ncbi:MAG: leucine--tRNA ligase [Planctomycetes bacterium]|nr:leucine--tRNA ligase [Planctomycetota bacterium]